MSNMSGMQKSAANKLLEKRNIPMPMKGSTLRFLQVCRYYLQGQCWYGDKCRYDHIRPKYKTTEKESEEPK